VAVRDLRSHSKCAAVNHGVLRAGVEEAGLDLTSATPCREDVGGQTCAEFNG